jgi:hypothetical protein
MKRYVPGIGHANGSTENSLADGLFLGRVERVQYCRQGRKPYYLLLFKLLEPKSLAGYRFSARLYCTSKTFWKFNWFLRDFGYDSELLERDEIDEKRLIGLMGVVKTRRAVLNGTCVLALDGFAPSSQWQELIRGFQDHATRTGGGS